MNTKINGNIASRIATNIAAATASYNRLVSLDPREVDERTWEFDTSMRLDTLDTYEAAWDVDLEGECEGDDGADEAESAPCDCGCAGNEPAEELPGAPAPPPEHLQEDPWAVDDIPPAGLPLHVLF